jgi:hypothetical protein
VPTPPAPPPPVPVPNLLQEAIEIIEQGFDATLAKIKELL